MPDVLNRPNTAIARETITVSTVAIGITAANLVHGSGIDAGRAVISCEGNPIRYSTNGVAPTAAIGIPLAVGATATIIGITNLRNLRMIRSGASDGTIQAETYLS